MVDCNTQDSQVLLERPALKDFKINICNSINSWEFEQKSKVTEVFSFEFAKELSPTACVFEVWTAYQPCLDDNDELWEEELDSSDNLSSIPKHLCFKYWDFFNTHNADRLASHWATDHVIDLKPDTEPLYMRMYNMLLAELKALDNYINNTLAKE